MRVRRADEAAFQRALADVVGVAALAAQQALVFQALDRGAEPPRCHSGPIPALRAGLPHEWGRQLDGAIHGPPDRRVPGAAAEVARDALLDLLRRRLGVLPQQPDHRQHEAGRAEAALQAVTFVEGLLDGVQRSAVAGEALDGRHVMALPLDREHQARAHRRPVEQHGAAAAHPVLAADVRAGQAEVVAQVVGQEAAWIARAGMLDAVHPHAANALSASTRTRCSRNSGVASRSPLGCRPRAGSARSAITGVGATPNSVRRSPARTTPARAKSPCRRDSSRMAWGPRKAGNQASTRSSYGASAVSKTP